jgi:tetratricopeptide (TPR) repeat protein
MELRQAAVPRLLSRMAAGDEDAERLKTAYGAEEAYLAAYRTSLAGAPQEVFRRLEVALALDPSNESVRARAFLHYALAASQAYNQGQLPQAASLMQRAVALWGSSAQAHAELAIVLFRLGDTQRTIATLERALELNPRLVLARRVLADAFLQVGRKQEAVEQLRALLEIEPEDASAREILSHL